MRLPVLVCLLPLVIACGEDGPDLPEGWEEAEPILEFEQSDCGADPSEGYETGINVQVSSGAADVTWTNQPFRCEQPVEAYIRREGAGIDVLVQPVEIHPEEVVRCDCLYDLGMGFNMSDSETSITFYTRNDEAGGPSSPSRIGTVTIGQ